MEEEGALESRIYRPILLPRRGELIAWVCALMCAAAWLLLVQAKSPVFFGLKLLAVLLVLIAGAISLGNWMDRRTLLKIDTHGIAFENGLRKVALGWQDIRQVEVITSTLGDKVRVLGETAHFDFRTLAEVRMDGVVKGRMGFQDGEQIVKEIVRRASLRETGETVDGCVYYAPQ
jgi:hypothetical protein